MNYAIEVKCHVCGAAVSLEPTPERYPQPAWFVECQKCHFRGPTAESEEQAIEAYLDCRKALADVPLLVASMNYHAQTEYITHLLADIERYAGIDAFGIMLAAVRIREQDGFWAVRGEFSRE